ncbi:MAG: methyltransferase domain-containing protein [Deltaproteobacteria bacterium]|nr:methyltransferase domain-containing protein [Deltaproteobacteria bacterium]
MSDDKHKSQPRMDSELPPPGRKRRPSRGLRVPNDPVPRLSMDRIETPSDEMSRPTMPSIETSVQNSSVIDVPAAPFVVSLDRDALRENEHLVTVEDDAPVVDLATPNPAPVHLATPGPASIPRPRSSVLPPALEAAPPKAEEQSVVVRQVRRRIRSIGTDEAAEPLPVEEDESESFTLEDDGASIEVASLVMAHPPAISLTSSEDSSALVSSLLESLENDNAESLDHLAALADEPSEPATRTASMPPPPPGPTPSALRRPSFLPPSIPAPAQSAEPELVTESEELMATPSLLTSLEDLMEDADDDSLSDVQLETVDEIAIEPVPPPNEAAHATESKDGEAPPPRPPPRPSNVESAARPTIAESRATRRRQWWEEIFNDDYLRTLPKYTPQQVASEGDFIEASLGVERGATVLDLGCGVGRHAIELSKRGYDILGLDLSLAMLARASEEAQNREAKLNFLHADMGEMDFQGNFDAAYCMGSTYGCFDDEKNTDLVHRVHRALKPGGTFLLEVVNRDYAAEQHPSMVWYEADGCVCMEETNFNWFTSRLESKRTLLLEDGKQREHKFSLRLYSLHELGKSLSSAGFRVIEVSGHPKTPGAFFGSNSRTILILAQKRENDA